MISRIPARKLIFFNNSKDFKNYNIMQNIGYQHITRKFIQHCFTFTYTYQTYLVQFIYNW